VHPYRKALAAPIIPLSQATTVAGQQGDIRSEGPAKEGEIVERTRQGDSTSRVRRQCLALLLLAAILTLAGLPATSVASPAGAGLAAAKPLVAAPKITRQPSSVAVLEGQPASFEANATGSPTAQWQISLDNGSTWNPIAGATSNSYAIAATKSTENGDEFRVTFKNAGGEVTSRAVVLTVETAPAVTRQPVSVTADEGATVTFEASASGTPAPTVQWQYEPAGGTWHNVAGAISDLLKLTAVKVAESENQYRAVFNNAAGEATSEPATLTVVVPPKVTKQPSSTTVKEGEPAIFEAAASGVPAAAVQWETSLDNGATWSPIPEAVYPQLVIIGTKGSYTGREYRAVFTNSAGTAISSVATLTVEAKPTITLQPSSVTILTGASASFKAAATGLPTPTVQWEVSSNEGASWSAVAGATATTLNISNAQLSQNGYEYRAAFTNVVGTTYTSAATLTVSATDYEAYGWGMNTHGQVGVGSSSSAILAPTPISSLQFVTAVSGGARHSLALTAGGSVYAWGFNSHEQLGGEGPPTRSPILVEAVSGAKAVAAGGSHSLALLRNGTVMAWGNDESGQLGNGKTSEAAAPAPVSGLSGVVAVAAGEDHSLALLSDGTVMAWGDNERGQLGDGKTNNSDVPVAVHGLSGVKAIAAGGNFSLALLEDGTVMAWGDDSHYQLGNRSLIKEDPEEEEPAEVEEEETGPFSETPVPVEGLSGVTAIAAGKSHSLALLEGGTVMAWGKDSEGELGDGAFTGAVETPALVEGLSHVTEISAGDQDSVALLSTGQLESWGSDNAGSLGNGLNGPPDPRPEPVLGLTQAAGVSAGASHMLAFGKALPGVTGVSPAVGPSSGGATVTISGIGLGGATAVDFGSTPATSFTVESQSTIVATTPPGSGTVNVTVTTASGTSPVVTADRYTYRLAPTVTKLSAKGGPATGGTVVTITGTELSEASAVHFGAVEAEHVTVVSPTSITATAPANVGGSLSVTVTTPGGTSVASTKARFKYAPVVEALSPSSGSLEGGGEVTVSGAGFASGEATAFKFGKGKVTTVHCESSTTCTVVAPKAKSPGAVDVIATVEKIKSAAEAGDRYTYE